MGLAAARLAVAHDAGVEAVERRDDGRARALVVDAGLLALPGEDAAEEERPHALARHEHDDAARLRSQQARSISTRGVKRTATLLVRAPELLLHLLHVALGVLQPAREFRGRGLRRLFVALGVPVVVDPISVGAAIVSVVSVVVLLPVAVAVQQSLSLSLSLRFRVEGSGIFRRFDKDSRPRSSSASGLRAADCRCRPPRGP